MEINLQPSKKILTIYLTHGDQQNQDLCQRARALCAMYKAQKYTAAIFFSGGQNLAENTGALLAYNQRRSAELAVQQEKQSRTD